MMEAYSSRDSIGYTRLFDAAYLGQSLNPIDPINPRIEFDWPDEQRHIQALAEKATITAVNLNFGSSLALFHDLGDPPGWATIQTSAMQLEILDGADVFRTPAYVLEEFKFIPTTPDAASSTDTTWKIIRWTEIAP